MDLLSELGALALGSRLRRLTDRLAQDVTLIYKELDIDFEPRWFPVYYLLSRKSPLSIMDIAKILDISHPAVNQIAGEMIKHGVVDALKDDTDKRKRLLTLTDKGRDMLPVLQDIWDDVHRAVQSLLESTGSEIMQSIHKLEGGLDERGLYARYTECQSRKLRSSIEIVESTPELLPHFKALNLEWIEKYFRVEAADEKVLNSPEAEILDKGGVILFARRENCHGEVEVLGTCALVKLGNGMVELAKMAVTEKVRGKKIGQKLMEAAIRKARELDAGILVLETNTRLIPAINLYKKMGFIPVEADYHSPNSDTEPHYERVDLRMRLEL